VYRKKKKKKYINRRPERRKKVGGDETHKIRKAHERPEKKRRDVKNMEVVASLGFTDARGKQSPWPPLTEITKFKKIAHIH
jgi:hypothetical protein